MKLSDSSGFALNREAAKFTGFALKPAASEAHITRLWHAAPCGKSSAYARQRNASCLCRT